MTIKEKFFNKKIICFSTLILLLFALISLAGNPHAYTWKLWYPKQNSDAVTRYHILPQKIILISTKFAYDDSKSDWAYSEEVLNNYIIEDEKLEKIFAFANEVNDFVLTFHDLENEKNLISGKIVISFNVKNLTPSKLDLLDSSLIANGIFTYKNNILIKKYDCNKNECAKQISSAKLKQESYLIIEPKISLDEKILKIISTPFTLMADAALGAVSLIAFLIKLL